MKKLNIWTPILNDNQIMSLLFWMGAFVSILGGSVIIGLIYLISK